MALTPSSALHPSLKANTPKAQTLSAIQLSAHCVPLLSIHFFLPREHPIAIARRCRPRRVQTMRPPSEQPSTDRERRTWEEQRIGGPSIYISRMARVNTACPTSQTRIPGAPRIWSAGRSAGGPALHAPGWRVARETTGSLPRYVCQRRAQNMLYRRVDPPRALAKAARRVQPPSARHSRLSALGCS